VANPEGGSGSLWKQQSRLDSSTDASSLSQERLPKHSGNNDCFVMNYTPGSVEK